MAQLTVVGKFKAQPFSRELTTSSKGTVGAKIGFIILEHYDPVAKRWEGWQGRGLTIEHTFWIYKADNTEIAFAHKALKEGIGWTGDLMQFDESVEWNMPTCRIETEDQEYNGKTYTRVKWLNPLDHDSSDGGGGKIKGRSAIEALQRRLSGQAPLPPPPPSEPGSDDIPF